MPDSHENIDNMHKIILNSWPMVPYIVENLERLSFVNVSWEVNRHTRARTFNTVYTSGPWFKCWLLLKPVYCFHTFSLLFSLQRNNLFLHFNQKWISIAWFYISFLLTLFFTIQGPTVLSWEGPFHKTQLS